MLYKKLIIFFFPSTNLVAKPGFAIWASYNWISSFYISLLSSLNFSALTFFNSFITIFFSLYKPLIRIFANHNYFYTLLKAVISSNN